jgi:predicted phage terminase large subunit-like protein
MWTFLPEQETPSPPPTPPPVDLYSHEAKQALAIDDILWARKSFWEYRIAMNPRLILRKKWFPRSIARELRDFHDDFKAGKRPILLLQTPPQHGKSLSVIDFIAWCVGHDPELRVIYASFSDRLGIRANLRLQRSLDSKTYKQIFPETYLTTKHIVTIAERHLRNHEVLEFVGHEGYFRNTTVGGAITGEALDLAVIDDPIKGRAEASSEVTRDKTWNWITDDVFSRFSETAGLIMIMTRWHLDDPAGRFLEHFGKGRIKIVRYPAIAEEDEKYRRAGEPLFPELKSMAFLQERRKLYTEASWAALYQQNPFIVGGGIFPIDKIKILPLGIDRTQVLKSVRYYDKAGTEDDGACTAGALIHKMRDGRIIIEHVCRGQWGSLERERQIKAWAERDRANCRPGAYEIGVEQEPGSGGKESAESTIRNLAGFKVFADKVTGSKEIRAEPFAAQVQGGNVWLVAGGYVNDLLDEMQSFPNGKYKDQVDACSGAFNRLVSGPVYNLFSGCVD